YYSDLPKFDKKWSGISSLRFRLQRYFTIIKTRSRCQTDKDFYLGREEPISEKNFKKHFRRYQHFLIFTDRLFAVGTKNICKAASEANSSSVYYYYFNYGKGANKESYLFSDKDLEVGHGEDGIHFYGFLLINEPSESDKKLKTVGQNMLYSYASTGNFYYYIKVWTRHRNRPPSALNIVSNPVLRKGTL
ncbi:hypothetical protein NQ317_007217, partial [Molorchus minor]